MTIKVGQKLPESTLLQKTSDGPRKVALSEKLKGRKVVLFGLPGAFTPTCDSAHLPSFMRTKDAFVDAGVDEIICVSVNDIHVMELWGRQSGAQEAGITMLADADCSFTKSIGMDYSNPEAGMFDRSKRYAMLVEDGTVVLFQPEEKAGVCEISAGEALLANL